ncbi:hypothetical protein CR513_34100, partial [Mucuna pruriens]
MNLHSEFPNFDDFKDCDCTCTKLIECPICVEISACERVINTSEVVEVVATQPPLPSTVQPLQSLAKSTTRSIKILIHFHPKGLKIATYLRVKGCHTQPLLYAHLRTYPHDA